MPCKITWYETAHAHQAAITGIENIAKEIALTQKCIRTRALLRQIEALQKEPGKTRNSEILKKRPDTKNPRNKKDA